MMIITAFFGRHAKWEECVRSWDRAWVGEDGSRGMLPAYERAWRALSDLGDPAIAFLHNDLRIDEPWVERVEAEFDDSGVGVVGFGGALWHGSPSIYKTPYNLQQLGRSHYLSNVTDAEVHGRRFEGARDVAVLDGFALIVRRAMLERAGGWPIKLLPPHHCYDYWVCCMAHRLGYRVRLVGVKCHHYGGLTATAPQYQEWAAQTKWGSDSAMHEAGHCAIYEEFRDVLPWRESA